MQKISAVLLLSAVVGAAHAAPVIQAFDADHIKVVDGQPVRLQWDVSGATSVTLNGKAVSGNSQIVKYAAGDDATLRYTLVASAGDAQAYATRTIELSPGVLLDKGYIPEAYAAGCAPVAETDFVLGHEYARIEPRDCTSVKVRNPVFVWPSQFNVTDMTLTVNFPSGKSPLHISTTRTSLILPELLTETGLYTWQVQYQLPAGGTRLGAVRRFHFDGNALNNLPDLPTAADVKARIGQRLHPRLIPLGANGQVMQMWEIHAAVQASPLAPSYATYLREADQVLANTLYAMPALSPCIPRRPILSVPACSSAPAGSARSTIATRTITRLHLSRKARIFLSPGACMTILAKV